MTSQNWTVFKAFSQIKDDPVEVDILYQFRQELQSFRYSHVFACLRDSTYTRYHFFAFCNDRDLPESQCYVCKKQFFLHTILARNCKTRLTINPNSERGSSVQYTLMYGSWCPPNHTRWEHVHPHGSIRLEHVARNVGTLVSVPASQSVDQEGIIFL